MSLATPVPVHPNAVADISEQAENDSPKQAMLKAFLTILVSEVGDKTFFIACIMAMRHPRLQIFTAAISSLVVMTVLSAYGGHILMRLISPRLSKVLAGILFLVFGIKMIADARGMKGTKAQEEMEEVRQELLAKEQQGRDRDLEGAPASGAEDDAEAPSHPVTSSTSAMGRVRAFLSSARNLLGLVLSEVWIEAFVLTFLAEWGDRSQIATVALAGSDGFVYVSIGGIVGHALCTGLAVLGGKFLASRISAKTITFAGALLFLVFGCMCFGEAWWEGRHPPPMPSVVSQRNN
jgi:Ca2+/H+ antiporter, TMEM165/GDT1 family